MLCFPLTHFCCQQQSQAAVGIPALLWVCTVLQRRSPWDCDHPSLLKEESLPAAMNFLISSNVALF